MRFRRGDTLVEVMAAIGVFSMVAISIASTMSMSTANVQTALETTMTRNEIDTQAEALRFIHDAYIAERSIAHDATTASTFKQGKYTTLWERITRLAQSPDSGLKDFDIVRCQDLYRSTSSINIFNKAFVINTRKLSAANPDTEDVVVVASTGSTVFTDAPLYPRLLFAEGGAPGSDLNLFADQSHILPSDLYHAEGIFITAIKDAGTDNPGSGISTSANISYYDFYIRACWYGPGENTPLTISTLVRLHEPTF